MTTDEPAPSKAELLHALHTSRDEVVALVRGLPPERLEEGRYENGWNGRQILAHIASIEWSYPRLIEIARTPPAPAGAPPPPCARPEERERELQRAPSGQALTSHGRRAARQVRDESCRHHPGGGGGGRGAVCPANPFGLRRGRPARGRLPPGFSGPRARPRPRYRRPRSGPAHGLMFWFSCEKGEGCGVRRATSQNGLYLSLSSSAGSRGGVTGLWRTWRPARAPSFGSGHSG